MVKTKEIIAICLVMLLAAAALPLVASADVQAWYLNDTLIDTGLCQMDKGAPEFEDTSVSIAASSSVVWRADEVLQGCTFPAGIWDGTIEFTSTPSGGTIELDVGYWDGSFTSNGNTQTLSPNGTSFVINIDANLFTVVSGDYLAFKVTNNTNGTIYVDTGGSQQSSIASPSTDPGYPIPELPTIVLLAAGLVCLAGYLGLKRPKGVYLKA